MTHCLFLNCSPLGEASLSAQLVSAARRDAALTANDLAFSTRTLADEPPAPLSAGYAQAITSQAPHSDPALALSERLISELEACDRLLVATPMHNFTAPAALKLWIDHVLRAGRSFSITPEGKVGLLRDRPTRVLVRSGGPCHGDRARQPDFLTPWLRYALSTLGIHNVQFIWLSGQTPDDDAIGQTRMALREFFLTP